MGEKCCICGKLIPDLEINSHLQDHVNDARAEGDIE
jgi:hypothetical protein